MLLYLLSSFFSIIRPHPISTLFPYTTLFRSLGHELNNSLAPIQSVAQSLESSLVMATKSSGVHGDSFAGVLDDLRQRSEEHTSELQSLRHLVCRLLLEKKKKKYKR